MLVPFSLPANFERYRAAIAAGLRCERAGEVVCRVQSESVPGRWYKVTLEEGGYSCNCRATAQCKRGSAASVKEFPYLLTGWLLAECASLREARHEADCRAWRDGVVEKVQEEEAETARMIRFNAEMHELRLAEYPRLRTVSNRLMEATF